jgi:NAD(P)-dependent dehydrogenase (short-subunit alcohol dehydrogenase family)
MAKSIALVTGGTTGIGKAICDDLLGRGYGVVTIARHAPKRPRKGVACYTADLADTAAARAIGRELVKRHAITHFVHNSGTSIGASLADSQSADYDYSYRLHVDAAVALAQAVVPPMQKRRFGRIVLMSSRAALGRPDRGAYSTTKAAMLALTRVWALEFGAHGITVNAVAPGPIATDNFLRKNPPTSPIRRKLEASIVVGRIGTPEEVAHAVAFLLARESGFITGQTLFVCGGMSVGAASLL